MSKRMPFNPQGDPRVHRLGGRTSALHRTLRATGVLPDDWADRNTVLLYAAEIAQQPTDDYSDILSDIDRFGYLRSVEQDHASAFRPSWHKEWW